MVCVILIFVLIFVDTTINVHLAIGLNKNVNVTIDDTLYLNNFREIVIDDNVSNHPTYMVVMSSLMVEL